jgi:hypothetical protein
MRKEGKKAKGRWEPVLYMYVAQKKNSVQPK